MVECIVIPLWVLLVGGYVCGAVGIYLFVVLPDQLTPLKCLIAIAVDVSLILCGLAAIVTTSVVYIAPVFAALCTYLPCITIVGVP